MTIATSSPFHTYIDADPGRRERKRRQKVDHLVATAFCLFEAKGYETVTMEQIAAGADVAKGTLYNHFPVKEALLAQRFHDELADGMPQLQAAMEALPNFSARMTYLLRASADWSEAHRTYFPYYLHFRLANADCGQESGKTRHPRSGLDRLFEALIRTGQEAGELRTDYPFAQLAHMFQFLYLGAMMRWLALPDGDLRRELDAVLDLFLHGLAVPPSEGKNDCPHS